MLVSSVFFLFGLFTSATRAQVQPTTPGPNQTYAAGSPCQIAWTSDDSGHWLNMTIDLMSGSNSNMSLVTNVASGLDGTNSSLTPFSWTCPEVTPYSAIYFYQFTNGNETANATWTTRFTITSLAGQSQPPNSTAQPNGEPIPWGVGQIAQKAIQASAPGDSKSISLEGERTSALASSSVVPDPSPSRGHDLEGSSKFLLTTAPPNSEASYETSTSSRRSKHHHSAHVHESKGLNETGDTNSDDNSTREHERHTTNVESSEIHTHRPSAARKDSPFASAETSAVGDCHCNLKGNGALRLDPQIDVLPLLLSALALCLVNEF